jgi:hypothetical protein
MTALPNASVVVRTSFGDDGAWESLAVEVQTPSDDGFVAHVTLVNNPAFEGMSVDALWSVENNINLANMDWADFTTSVHGDGIFRGF